MKKLNSKLFQKNSEISQKEMKSVLGGTNKSDVAGGNTDTKGLSGNYDIAVESLLDIYPTKTVDDKPTTSVCLNEF
jgi:natural product precursor